MKYSRTPVIIVALLAICSFLFSLLLTKKNKTAELTIRNYTDKDRQASFHLDRISTLNWWEGEALILRYMKLPAVFKCKNPVWYGPVRSEGGWLVCNDEPFKPKPGCLVYSFGIGNLWQFDEEAEKVGCDVYAFDPSMHKPDHKHSERIWFYDMGLGGKDSDSFVPVKDIYVTNQQIWKMRTFRSILKMLNHENRVIDIVKVDIEGNEIQVLHNLLETNGLINVKQFILEYHVFGERLYEMGQLAMDMKYLIEKAGFLPFKVGTKVYYKKYENPGKEPIYRWQADTGYINSRFLNL